MSLLKYGALALLAILVFSAFVSGASETIYEDLTGWGAAGSNTHYVGSVIYANVTVNLTRAETHPSVTCGYIALMDSSCNILENATVTNHNATFTTQLTANTVYLLVAHNGGAACQWYGDATGDKDSGTLASFTNTTGGKYGLVQAYGSLGACTNLDNGEYNIIAFDVNNNSAAPPSTPEVNFTVTANNSETFLNISIFNATINGTFYSTTNGTINTNISNSTNYLVNITLNATGYYNGVFNNINLTWGNFTAVLDPIPFFNVTASDYLTNESISVFNATINGTYYNTTNGTIFTPLDRNTAFNINIYVSAVDYFSANYTHNISNNLNASLSPQIRFYVTAVDYLGERSFYNWTVAIYNETDSLGNYTSQDTIINELNITAQGDVFDTNVFDIAINKTINGIMQYTDNSTLTIGFRCGTTSGSVCYVKANFVFKDGTNFTTNSCSAAGSQYYNCTLSVNSSQIINFVEILGRKTGDYDSGNFFCSDPSIPCIYNYITQGYINVSNAQYQGNYTILTNMSGFSTSPQNITLTANNLIFEHTLFNSNTAQITILSEENLTLLSGVNVSIEAASNTSTSSTTTTTGYAYFDNLSGWVFSVGFTAGGFGYRQYVLDYGTTYQNLNLTAYLSTNATGSTSILVKEVNTNTALEGCTVTTQRFINGSFVTINSALSDVTGAIYLSYAPYTAYRFVVSCSGYESKVFVLNPIIFSTYTVYMEGITGDYESIEDYYGVSIVFNPKVFYTGNNTFAVSFGSGTGSFTSYGFNISYPGGTNGSGGVNAYGEMLSVGLNISGASFWDTVNISIYYDTTYTDNKIFNYTYPIQISDAGAGTFIRNQAEKYGLGDFEAALIAVSVALLVAGAAAYFAGSIAAGVSILALLGYFTYIGMLPFWAVILSALAGFVVITWRSGS